MIFNSKTNQLKGTSKQFRNDRNFNSSKVRFHRGFLYVVAQNQKKHYKIDIKSLTYEESNLDF